MSTEDDIAYLEARYKPIGSAQRLSRERGALLRAVHDIRALFFYTRKLEALNGTHVARIQELEKLTRALGQDKLEARHLARETQFELNEANRRLGVITDSARDGLEDCDDDYEMSAYWVFMVATGQDETDTQPKETS